jgi:serine/threonine protein kinase
MIGQTILHYKITEKLGEGGMGVVFRAEDTKLKRDVAIKFLPRQVAASTEEHQRFKIEAQSAAALNHANVAHIYAIEEIDDELFIVMEYINGSELKKIVDSEQLPLDVVMDIATQTAGGLKAAHDKGIVHRDIKSANIMITNEGQVKIMDFGLAKVNGSAQLTKVGSTLGTTSYMSPEQMRGEEIDTKSDIWSFGVVLYEMLTAQLPFKGDYDQAIIYSIMNENPEPVTVLRPGISTELERIVNKALEKDKKDRYQHVDEVLADLRQVFRDSSSENEIPNNGLKTPVKKSRAYLITGAILSILILVFFANVLFKSFSRQSPAGPMKTTRFTSYPGLEEMPAFSPDGNHLAFVWNGEAGDNHDIYVKTIADGEYTAHRVTNHPNDELNPVWSPDGKFIAFHRVKRIWRSSIVQGPTGIIYQVPAMGGNARRITSGFQPNWSPDGKTLVLSDMDTTNRKLCIYLFFPGNGERLKLTQPPAGFHDYHPVISPDGKRLAFLRTAGHPKTNTDEIYIVPIAGGKPQALTSDNIDIRGLQWTTDGRDLLVSSRHGGPFALWRIPVSGGEPEPVAAVGESSIDPAISPDEYRLAYVKSEGSPGTRSGGQSIWRYEIPKIKDQIIPPKKIIYSGSHNDERAVYSPDGKWIAFQSRRSVNREIWLCDNEGRNPIQLTSFGGSRVASPRWSPDSKSIVFSASPDGHRDIFTITIEGGQPKRLTSDSAQDDRPSWSRDNRWIYFVSNRTGTRKTWKVPAQGGKPIQETFQANFGFRDLEASDGNWFYYLRWIGNKNVLVKTSTDGGKESLVFQFPSRPDIYGWVPFADGVYFHHWDEKGVGSIQFFDFATQKTKKIINLQSSRQGYMDVSPDRRYILYTHKEEPESDIMLVENWR